MNLTQMKVKYQEYLADFDPTPQYAFDDWASPMDFDDYCDYLHEEEYETKNHDWDGGNRCLWTCGSNCI